jgi:hypothetical protein
MTERSNLSVGTDGDSCQALPGFVDGSEERPDLKVGQRTRLVDVQDAEEIRQRAGAYTRPLLEFS